MPTESIDRVNVSRVRAFIAKAIAEGTKDLVWAENDEQTRENLKSTIAGLLGRLMPDEADLLTIECKLTDAGELQAVIRGPSRLLRGRFGDFMLFLGAIR